MIRLIFTSALLFGFLYSCSNIQNKHKETPSFVLERDLYDFSNKLDNNDTMILLVDASVCAWVEIDSLVITKSNDKISIQPTIWYWSDEKEILKLDKVQYSTSNDSLNLENLFKYLHKKGIQDEHNNPIVFTLFHKDDTLHFYSANLGDHLENLSYFQRIMGKLYPDAKHFEPERAPVLVVD